MKTQKKELLFKALCDYLLIQYLLEWHFDIYGLIPKGLAIDINTL